MKRFTLVILALFFILINTFAFAAQNFVKKDIAVTAADGFNLKATLIYPKIKGKQVFNTVVLLHSYGTDSGWWQDLPDVLLQDGYAVLSIDLRGHGQSVYNSKLLKVSWKNLTNSAYAKYPDDIKQIIEYIQTEYPKMKFFDKWAIVGSDVGGCAGVLAADKLEQKPETIVLLSPVIKTRTLYIPVAIAQLSSTDFLAIASQSDTAAVEADLYLKKFAQKEFATYHSKSNSSGMVLLKNDPEIIPLIDNWLKQYLNSD